MLVFSLFLVLVKRVFFMHQLSFSTQSSTFFGSLTTKKSEKSTCTNYRYGFQNQEEDDEIKGEGNSVNYKYRMHDPRLGRFFAIDPLVGNFPNLTPYQFSHNSPVYMIELEGAEGMVYVYKAWYDNSGYHTSNKPVTSYQVEGLKTNVNKTVIKPFGNPDGKTLQTKYTQITSDGSGPGASVTFDANWKPNIKELNNIFGDNMPKEIAPREKSFAEKLNEASPSWARNGAMEGGDEGVVPFEQGIKIMGGTVAVILTGGTIALAGEVSVLSAASLAAGVDDISTQADGSSLITKATGISPKTLDKLKLGVGITSFTKGTQTLIKEFSKKGSQWTDKNTIDMFNIINDELNSTVSGADQLKKDEN